MEFKRTLLSLCAIGFASSVFAGGELPAPECTNHPVTVPCARSAWDIGFTAYWVTPNIGRGLFFHDDYSLNSAGVLVDNTHYLKAKHRFGYDIEGSYHWGTGTDFTARWTRFHKSYDSTENFTTNILGAASITESWRINFDSVDLEIGQQIDVGPNWGLRSHFGVEYLKLFSDMSPDTMRARSTENILTQENFKGAGVRTGLDGAYHLTEGLNLVGRGAVSVLYGKKSSLDSDYIFSANGTLDTTDSFITLVPGRKIFVIGADTKLGLSVSRGGLSLEGGYAGRIYLNPLPTSGDLFGIGGAYATLMYVS